MLTADGKFLQQSKVFFFSILLCGMRKVICFYSLFSLNIKYSLMYVVMLVS